MSTRLSYIASAINGNKTIRIKYTKYDGTTSIRTISDIHYSKEFGSDYIECFCHLRQERRTFKISRIEEIDGISFNSTPKTSYTSTSYGTSYPRTTYTPPKKSEGCYIATMVYGDYDHPKVMILRRYRDEILKKSFLGRLFIRVYYFVSPKLVSILKNCKRINSIIRKQLDRIVERL